MVSLKCLSALFCILSFVNHACQGIPSSFFDSSENSFWFDFSESESWTAEDEARAQAKNQDRISSVSAGFSTSDSQPSEGSFASKPLTSSLGRNSKPAGQRRSAEQHLLEDTKISESLKISTLLDVNPEEAPSTKAFKDRICSSCHLVHGGSSVIDESKASPLSEGSFSAQPIATSLARNSGRGPTEVEPTLGGRKQKDHVIPEGMNTKIPAKNAEEFDSNISDLDARSSTKIPSNSEAKSTGSLKISTLIDMISEEASSHKEFQQTGSRCTTCHLVGGGSSSKIQLSEGSSESQPALEPFFLGLNSGPAKLSAKNAPVSPSEISNLDIKMSSKTTGDMDTKIRGSLKISMLLDMNPEEEASISEASKPTVRGCSSCHLVLGGSSSVSKIYQESSDSLSTFAEEPSFSEESPDLQHTFSEESSDYQPTSSASSPVDDLDVNSLVKNDAFAFLSEILASSPAESKPTERGCRSCYLAHGG